MFSRNPHLVRVSGISFKKSYLPDGTPDEESSLVTTDTLYDLASVTKMFTVDYALQKLVTDGEVDLDARITDFLGDRFVLDTALVPVNSKGEAIDPDSVADIETIRKWKSKLTIRDLLKHQGGFPGDGSLEKDRARCENHWLVRSIIFYAGIWR